MVAVGDNKIVSGKEPFLIACSVPASGIIIIVPGASTILYK